MKFPSIKIYGNILSSDILDKIEQGDILGQLPKDFGFDGKVKVKDEIARAWADAQSQWKIYKSRIETLKDGETGTSETRRLWIVPLLTFLGYELESSKAEIVNGKSYAISHRAQNIGGFPVHVMGCNDSLDKRRTDSGPRMSPHSLVQEYINLTEHLYAIVSNGYLLRLIRDSSRLVKLSYLEFDLELMMDDDLFTDFAVMYRLIHYTRMPKSAANEQVSLIEQYHEDALESGSRIRAGLSKAVKESILILGTGFLNDPSNGKLRELIESGRLLPDQYHRYLLRIIYRILFLFVIEERGLVFPDVVTKKIRDIYRNYYSLGALRKLCEKKYFTNQEFNNYWIQARNTFRLFEDERYGKALEIKPLAGDLFEYDAIGILNECGLDNEICMQCIRNLSIFRNEITGATLPVNYAALNVEEFGSVYEGLLEFKPEITLLMDKLNYNLVKGSERSSSGSHYTPDELVKPLIQHSLDYIIDDKLKEADKEKALLSIKVCDVACGSGHILLNAARRIAFELAKLREKADQPSPEPLRVATRDVIKNCIYGVDKNELAVELCKIALWLEAHNPGEPLSFLDHKIKCGDSIVGLAHKEELERGIATEAFKELPGDDKVIASDFRKRNKEEIKSRHQVSLQFKENVKSNITELSGKLTELTNLPEHTPEEVKTKKSKYDELRKNAAWWRLKVLADIQVAQFFIPKTNRSKLVSDEKYFEYLNSSNMPQGEAPALAMGASAENRFFHWFLEFPEIFERGGFDCILGNPPFLGGQSISGRFGMNYLNYLKISFATNGSCDLVTYFFRYIYMILKVDGLMSLIATNSISQGVTRESGLEFIVNNKASITFAIKSMKWPGQAAVIIALVTLYKGIWKNKFILNSDIVATITPYLDTAETSSPPFALGFNRHKAFMGSTVFGSGFFIDQKEASALLDNNIKNKDVLFPIINGEDFLNRVDQSASRWVINFYDWDIDKAKTYEDCFDIVEYRVKPQRLDQNIKSAKEKWWQFHRIGSELVRAKSQVSRVLLTAITSKTLAFDFSPSDIVFSNAVIVFIYEGYIEFAVLQSNFHNAWCWKYASTLKTDLRYTPSDVFETFPFPQNLSEETERMLEQVGEEYHEFRRELMLNLQLGLTKTYNLFHTKDLTIDDKQLKKALLQIDIEQALSDIYKLRRLHKQMDEAVLAAYGWTDFDLKHDFYEVDYLPENDRVRYTIHPDARREILKRLLELNHKIHEEEVKAGLWEKKGKKSEKTGENKNNKDQESLF